MILSKKQAILGSTLLFLTILNIFIWISITRESNFSTLDFLDVGQGDASLLSFKNSGRILIDSGMGKSISSSLSKVLDFNNRIIDILIVTHADLDHFGGMKYVIERNNPRVLIYNGKLSQDRNFQSLLKLAQKKRINIISFSKGDKIRIGDDKLDILWPSANQKNESLPDNRMSLVIKANVENKNILFLGDSENKDLIKLKNLEADILKVSHHGSKTGASQSLIEKVSPQIALIGVGRKNKYGHPHSEVLSWLKYFGSEILRTDLLGNIRLVLE